ncbi:4'-phosphopantetheinyl transferase [Streptomyces sp. NPDC001389]|uniref:4'-phosphopantetheinyl transferase family protein n=1 Tax=unclassified Streptomyces TaxID=2593676 RepID=UPI0036A7A15D
MERFSLLQKVLPECAASAEAYDDDTAYPLFPEEASAVARSAESRRREFTTGRGCAHRALSGLGLPPAPVPRDGQRAPVWPAGVIGSITHCVGFRAAAVARAGELAVLGIDAEPHRPLPARVGEEITVGGERARLGVLCREAPRICWDTVLFSAKESVYKAWFPLTRAWLGFQDAEVGLRADGTFAVRVLPAARAVLDTGPSGFAGRWLVGRGLVITSVTSVRWPARSRRGPAVPRYGTLRGARPPFNRGGVAVERNGERTA